MGDYTASTATLSGDDILALADKCPKLEDFYILSFTRIDNWPQFTKPWTSLRTLTWWSISEPNVFCNVEFHQSLPNLEVLLLGIRNCSNTFILPDMGGCEKLKRIDLCGKGSMFVIRLPRALEYLRGDGDVTIVNPCLDKATLKRRHPGLRCDRINFWAGP